MFSKDFFMYRKCICYPYNTFKYFCHPRCQSISLLKIENIWMPLLLRQGAEEAVWGSQGDTEDLSTVPGQTAATAAAAEGDRGCGTHTKVLPPIQTGTCTPLLSLSLCPSLSHLNSNELQQKCTWFTVFKGTLTCWPELVKKLFLGLLFLFQGYL